MSTFPYRHSAPKVMDVARSCAYLCVSGATPAPRQELTATDADPFDFFGRVHIHNGRAVLHPTR